MVTRDDGGADDCARTGQHPDIVLIHCHDLGRWLPTYGMPSVPSSALNEFAGTSVVFDRAFSAAPLCTPARSALFTGLYPHQNGLMGLAHDGWRYRRSVRTLPELLGAAGYHSVLVGLQHEHTDPTVLGFDEVAGMGFLPRASVVADDAERWLEGRSDIEKPVFLTIGTWEVHRPWPAQDYSFANPDSVDVPGYLADNAYTRADIAAFHGSIQYFDEAFARMLAAVDRHCDPANTLVIFTTDHGAAFPRAKSTLYDSGVGVAMIMRPPTSWGYPPGHRNALVSHLDIVPTLLDICGAQAEAGGEGRSLLPDLRGATAAPSPTLLFFEKTYHDGYDPIRAVRSDDHKYIKNFVDGPKLTLAKDLEDSLTRRGMGDAHLEPRSPIELYDLRRDPDELTNLALDPSYAGQVAELERELLRWMARTRDPLLDGVVDPPPPRSRGVDAMEDLT